MPDSGKDRYTRRAEPQGWLSVKLSKTGAIVSLCEYTRVTGVRESGGRTWFTIADGNIEVGREASLASANAAKYLSPTGPGGAATMTVSYDGAPREEMSPFKGKLRQQWGRLTFDGKAAQVTLNSLWNMGYTPIPPGTHAILTPDYSHAAISTGPYARATPGMIGNDVWFPIGLNGTLANSSRYIHVGHLSEGCVTIHQLERWSEIYQYLIAHRVAGSGGKRIGTLVVRA